MSGCLTPACLEAFVINSLQISGIIKQMHLKIHQNVIATIHNEYGNLVSIEGEREIELEMGNEKIVCNKSITSRLHKFGERHQKE